MAEQIITLGIGGTPASLTPFITTGLEIGAVLLITTGKSANAIFVREVERRGVIGETERRVVARELERKVISRG